MAGVWSYLRAHHVALVALFVALAGTSYAAVKLPADSVGTKQLKDGAVTLKKVKASTVSSLKGGAVRLDWAAPAPEDGINPETLYVKQGLTVNAACEDGNLTEPGIKYPTVRVWFTALGDGSTANVTWTQLESFFPDTVSTFQDGAEDGTVTIVAGSSSSFGRIEGQAVLRSDSLVMSVVFHAAAFDQGANESCKLDGTVVTAT